MLDFGRCPVVARLLGRFSGSRPLSQPCLVLFVAVFVFGLLLNVVRLHPVVVEPSVGLALPGRLSRSNSLVVSFGSSSSQLLSRLSLAVDNFNSRLSLYSAIGPLCLPLMLNSNNTFHDEVVTNKNLKLLFKHKVFL